MKPLLLHSSSKTTNNHQRRVIHIEFSRSPLPNSLNWSEFMIVQASAKSTGLNKIPQETEEQCFVFPKTYSWREFKTLSALMGDSRTIHLNYLDGTIEIMTTSAAHEIIVHLLSMLLGIYFAEMDIDFIPTGSATLESEAKGASVEPDLSFCFGNKLGDRDLAIEVVFTSGNVTKLERYRRFNTKEVWFWEDGKFSIYRLREDGYETISQSECLPNLDLALLARCLLMAEPKSALKAFRQGL
jgi:Uma2 family endonuclease